MLFVIAGAALIWSYVTNRLPGRTVAIGLIAVLVIDLVSIERRYWIFSGGKVRGPLPLEEIREAGKSAELGADCLICPEGDDQWVSGENP